MHSESCVKSSSSTLFLNNLLIKANNFGHFHLMLLNVIDVFRKIFF